MNRQAVIEVLARSCNAPGQYFSFTATSLYSPYERGIKQCPVCGAQRTARIFPSHLSGHTTDELFAAAIELVAV
jgi:hypothetical protein